MLDLLIPDLRAGQSLTPEAVSQAVRALVDETVPAPLKADFLSALTAKGESPPEIAAFVHSLRNLSQTPVFPATAAPEPILDVCGTGGDHLRTFNISTTVALVAAAAGIAVAKHGNRAITSQCGSADVLEALGVRIDLDPSTAGHWLCHHRFAFFFAPRYHPAFRQIAPARKLCAERGHRTIFNLLGPLLNPARPTCQLIGVPRPEWCEPIGHVLQSIGVRRGMVVCGAVPKTALPPGAGADAWLDELSTLGENHIAEFHHDRGFHLSRLSPADLGVAPATLAHLAGGDPKSNARIVRGILEGQDRGPRRDAVLLNTAAALFIAGRTRSLTEGWEVADKTINQGTARAKLEELVAASA